MNERKFRRSKFTISSSHTKKKRPASAHRANNHKYLKCFKRKVCCDYARPPLCNVHCINNSVSLENISGFKRSVKGKVQLEDVNLCLAFITFVPYLHDSQYLTMQLCDYQLEQPCDSE